MPTDDDTSPAAILDLLLAQLAEIERGPNATTASRNALRHAKACEQCLAIHDQRVADRGVTGASE